MPVQPVKTVRTADGREAVADRVVVGFQDGVSDAEQEDAHRKAGARVALSVRVMRSAGGRAQVAVDLSGATSLEEAARTYRADPRVRYAEPDYIRRSLVVPNDPNLSAQWGLARIQAPAAWDVTRGSAQVIVAILDSGIYEAGSSTWGPGHPDLNGKVVARRNFTNSRDADDWVGHGTHVAGIVAANTDNGVGVAGVGYNVRLLNGKVINDIGQGTDSWIAEGIRWAADSGAQVINMSLGAPGPMPAVLQDAVNYAWSKNVVVVAAAGNTGDSAPISPASGLHVLAVASTDPNDARSFFSSFGLWVHVAAPGSDIFSTLNQGNYGNLSGTSMAAPHVSGLAALLWSTGRWTRAEDVVERLMRTSDFISGTGTLWQTGRINAARAVGEPPTATPTATTTPTPIATATAVPTATAPGSATPTATPTAPIGP